MKILQIHNYYKFKGGEDIVLDNEKNLLIRKGHEVIQIIRDNKKEIKSIKDIIATLYNLNYSLKSIKILENYIKNNMPDIVHIHNLFPLWTYSIIDFLYKKKIPIVMTLHNHRLILNKLNPKDKDYSKYGLIKNSKIITRIISKYTSSNDYLLSKVNKFIVLNKFSMTKLIKQGFDKNKFIIKPNFLNKKRKYSKNFKNKKDVIFSGRISSEKGIITLIKSWKNINLNLNIYGDGPLLNMLKKKNKDLKYIKFHGQKNFDFVDNKISKSKILIFPSEWFEPFGMSILQAFRAGTLVIGSNIPPLNSLIKDKFNGILFEPGNANDLTSKIKWALKNTDKCEIIIKNAFIDFNKKYSEEINYKMLFNAYKQSVDENKIRKCN